MGTLAITAMNIENQVAPATNVRAASNSPSNGNFATELDRNLLGKNNPLLTSLVNEPVAAAGGSSSYEDRKPTPQASAPSAVSLAAPVKAVFTAPANNSPTNYKLTSNGLPPSTGEPKSCPQGEESASGPPALDDALPVKTVSTLAIGSPDIGLKGPSVDRATPAEATSALPQSPQPQTFPTGQHRSADVAGSTPKRTDALDATSPANLDKGLLSAAVETPAPSQKVTAQLAPQDPSGSPKPRTGATQDKGSKAPFANPVTPAEESSTLPPSPRAQTLATGQYGSADVAGSTSRRMGALNTTSPAKLAKGLLSAAAETPAPSQKVTPQLALRDPSAEPKPRTGAIQDKVSKAPSANPATPAEGSSTTQPSQRAQAFVTGHHGSANVTGSPPERLDPTHATNPSNLSTRSQGTTLAPLRDVTTPSKLQDRSTRTAGTGATSPSISGKGSPSAAHAPLQIATKQLKLQDLPTRTAGTDATSPSISGKG